MVEDSGAMMHLRVRKIVFAVVLATGCTSAPEPEPAGGLDSRPLNETCLAPPRDQLPQTLTQTGCFTPGDASPLPVLIDFNVAMPLWADRAGKHRLFAIPPDTVIEVQPDGDFVFPIGSVMTKTFFRDGAAIETRLLVRHDDGQWAGYAYEWNAEQTDAALLEDAKELGDWRIPGRQDCLDCHTEAAGFTLGPQIPQMNTNQTYLQSGRTANQLVTLAEVGMLVGLPSEDPALLPKFPRWADEDIPLDDSTWSRAYLDVNCSQCHRPGGPMDANGDLRAATPLSEMGMCDEPPMFGDLGVAGALQLAPGDPSRSLLTLRMRDLGGDRMPSLATREIDDSGLAHLEAWTAALSDCTEESE